MLLALCNESEGRGYVAIIIVIPKSGSVGGSQWKDDGTEDISAMSANVSPQSLSSLCYNNFSCEKPLNLSVCPSIAKLQRDSSSKVFGSRSLVTAFDTKGWGSLEPWNSPVVGRLGNNSEWNISLLERMPAENDLSWPVWIQEGFWS